MLLHHQCRAPTTAGEELPCPRCIAPESEKELPSEPWKMGIHSASFKSGSIAPVAANPRHCEDLRIPCSLETKPTDAEAKAAGFASGQEWYAYSAGGALSDPEVAAANYNSLPVPRLDSPLDASPGEIYAFHKGQGSFFDTPEEPEEDLTAVLSREMQISHPYLLCDVEVGSREYLQSMRDRLAEVCKDSWKEGSVGKESLFIPLSAPADWSSSTMQIPDGLAASSDQRRTARRALLASQEQDPETRAILLQFKAKLAPYQRSKRATGESKPQGPLRPLALELYRVAEDGVLEREVIFVHGAQWVPYIPSGHPPWTTQRTWRKWCFGLSHETMVHPHRPFPDTLQVLRRMGFWPTLVSDSKLWYSLCTVCLRNRGSTVRPPQRTLAGDEAKMEEVLPWVDVMIDVQGPYTKAEGGEQYILSYHCTRLRVPKLAVMKTSQLGDFSRALFRCIMAAGQIPDIIRSDRGPEMTNLIMREFCAVCDIKQIFGSALIPHHQSIVETGHYTTMINHLILMNYVCKAFPQEWPALVPALEYLYETTSLGGHGLTAQDLTRGYSLASNTDKRFSPFMVKKGLPETDVAVRLFKNFKGSFIIFTRITQEQTLKDQLKVNQYRHRITLEPGQIVYRLVPKDGRTAKHLLNEKTKGPFVVVSQHSSTSAVLSDPISRQPVNGGEPVPIAQLLLAPPRAELVFDEDSEVRGIADMLQQKDESVSTVPMATTGHRSRVKIGWRNLRACSYVVYCLKPADNLCKLRRTGQLFTASE